MHLDVHRAAGQAMRKELCQTLRLAEVGDPEDGHRGS